MFDGGFIKVLICFSTSSCWLAAVYSYIQTKTNKHYHFVSSDGKSARPRTHQASRFGLYPVIAAKANWGVTHSRARACPGFPRYGSCLLTLGFPRFISYRVGFAAMIVIPTVHPSTMPTVVLEVAETETR